METHEDKKKYVEGLINHTIGHVSNEWERKLCIAMEDLAGCYDKVDDFFRIFDWPADMNDAVECEAEISDGEWDKILNTHHDLIDQTLAELGIYDRISAVYDNTKYADTILADFKEYIKA